MSVSFGFYNSNNHDRVYDTRQFSRLFNALIKDGVFMHIGSHFEVTAGSGMAVNVGTGYAWFNSTWTLNDAPLPIAPEESDLLLTRIDALVLEVDETISSRTNSIKFVKGTPSVQPQKPSLTNTNDIHQYALAYITIAPGAESLSQSNIENNIGKESCPFVTGILETIDISSLISQWEAQWNEWLNQQKQETDEFQKTSEEQFSAWFERIKGQLGEDAAGNLQNQIDDLQNQIDDLQNQIDALQNQIDALQNQIDALQNQIDAISPYTIYSYKATFLLNGWAGSGPYTQTVSVTPTDGGPGITGESQMQGGITIWDGFTGSTYDLMEEAGYIINSGTKTFGAGTITCVTKGIDKPACDVEIYFQAKKGGVL